MRRKIQRVDAIKPISVGDAHTKKRLFNSYLQFEAFLSEGKSPSSVDLKLIKEKLKEFLPVFFGNMSNLFSWIFDATSGASAYDYDRWGGSITDADYAELETFCRDELTSDEEFINLLSQNQVEFLKNIKIYYTSRRKDQEENEKLQRAVTEMKKRVDLPCFSLSGFSISQRHEIYREIYKLFFHDDDVDTQACFNTIGEASDLNSYLALNEMGGGMKITPRDLIFAIKIITQDLREKEMTMKLIELRKSKPNHVIFVSTGKKHADPLVKKIQLAGFPVTLLPLSKVDAIYNSVLSKEEIHPPIYIIPEIHNDALSHKIAKSLVSLAINRKHVLFLREGAISRAEGRVNDLEEPLSRIRCELSFLLLRAKASLFVSEAKMTQHLKHLHSKEESDWKNLISYCRSDQLYAIQLFLIDYRSAAANQQQKQQPVQAAEKPAQTKQQPVTGQSSAFFGNRAAKCHRGGNRSGTPAPVLDFASSHPL